jgi:hypothetical protein
MWYYILYNITDLLSIKSDTFAKNWKWQNYINSMKIKGNLSPQDYNDTEYEEIFNSKNSQIERNWQHTFCMNLFSILEIVSLSELNKM